MADQEGLTLSTPTEPDTFAPIAGEAFPVGTTIWINQSDKRAYAALAAFGQRPQSVGVAKTAGRIGERCIVKYGGVLRLSESQWDAVTGGTDGLNFVGYQYYVSPTTAGFLTQTRPTNNGQIICPIGIPISSTELLINPQEAVPVA